MHTRLFLPFLLLAALSAAALADTPAKISEDYRTQSAAALGKLNATLEKATTPLIAALIKSGDTAGAGQLTEQLKAKTSGEPVPTPHPSATLLFAQYDQARSKALEPAQKATISRIDAMLSGKEGRDLATVTELGKVREEVEGAKAVAIGAGSLFEGRSFYTSVGSEYHFDKDGGGYRLQKMDFAEKVPFSWTQRSDGIVQVVWRKQPDAPPRNTYFRFVDGKTALLGDSDTDINSPLKLGK